MSAGPSPYVSPLLPQHQALLSASCISQEVAEARGYRSIGRAEARELCFVSPRPGLLIPLYRVDVELGGYQFRPDDPRADKKGKPIKYESPRGQPNILDVPPTVREELHKGRQAILITEGAPKADALASLGIPCINVAGVYGWRGKNVDGGLTALGDWEMVNIAGSIFVLAFDSDILTKPEVHQALKRLKRFLESRGAEQVRVLVLPSLLSGKTGIDDYIFETGATAADLAKLVVDELPAPPSTETPVENVGPAPDLGELLVNVRAFIRRFVVVGNAELDVLALWITHSYAFEAADFTPYLHVNSPEKQSGKTRLLEVMKLLARSPWHTSRATVAVLVRKIARDEPTLLLDEVDAAFKGEKEYGEALRAILDAGYQRGGVASLCVGKGNDLVDLPVFCPKAFAGIGKKLPDTVLDRSIPISMKRRAPSETVERLRLRDAKEEAAPLYAKLNSWASSAIPALQGARPALLDGLGDRAFDVWEPLLAIADAAGAEWAQRARDAALKLSAGEARQDDSIGVRLLVDIRQGFEDMKGDKLFTADLLAYLNGIEESSWGGFSDNGMTGRDLSRHLDRYGIAPKQVRIGDRTRKGYDKEWFTDGWTRYCPLPHEKGETSETSKLSPICKEMKTMPAGVATARDDVPHISQIQPRHNVSHVSDKSPEKGVTEEQSAKRNGVTEEMQWRG